MSNPLYNGSNSNPLINGVNNRGGKAPTGNLISQFLQFKRDFKGDPQEALNNMLASGQVSEEQVKQAQEQAQSIMKLLGK